jgi:hypothetical protein
VNPENQQNNNLGSNEQNSPLVTPPPYPQDQAPINQIPQPQNNQYDSQVPLKRKSHKKLIIVIVAIVIIVPILIGILLSLAAAPQLKKQSNQAAKLNNNIESDTVNGINAINTAIKQYVSINKTLPITTQQSSTPYSIDLCGSSCSNGSMITAQLNMYSPGNVIFQKYSSGLKVPYSSQVYIVNNAQCNSSNTGLGAETSQTDLSAAILYIDPTTTNQVCVNA